MIAILLSKFFIGSHLTVELAMALMPSIIQYNTFLSENSFRRKYETGNVQMYVIDGFDKFRELLK